MKNYDKPNGNGSCTTTLTFPSPCGELVMKNQLSRKNFEYERKYNVSIPLRGIGYEKLKIHLDAFQNGVTVVSIPLRGIGYEKLN